jgi:glycosyltransferase involved in cell wall biosynthesis
MTSIIIPAHNEAAVIRRSLASLLDGALPGEFDILVVCNGCTDDTAEIAASFGGDVRVVETPRPSKSHALNLGDRLARGFPRIYVDADVVISAESVRTISDALQSPGIEAAAPKAITDTAGSGWLVRRFYQVWTTTPYFKEGMIGCGVYALNALGRRRFDAFPEIIADDGFVRALFSDGTRKQVDAATVTVYAPKTAAGLIRAKTRTRLGRYELADKLPGLLTAESSSKHYRTAIVSQLARPESWPAIPVYLLVNLIARYRARRQLAHLSRYRWERDASTRT